MRAMILAAGRGQRMRELTTHTPKPLLQLKGNYLIEHSIRSLIAAGVDEIVINVSYQAEKIKTALGDGKKYGVTIQYSEEPEALETGGGIVQALPMLGNDPFVVLSCDVISAYPVAQLPRHPTGLAHLVLVDNPDFNRTGDFNLEGSIVDCLPPCQLTYANIGIFHPELFAECKPGKFRLGDLLKQQTLTGRVTGEYFDGFWYNLGTPEQLSSLNALMA